MAPGDTRTPQRAVVDAPLHHIGGRPPLREYLRQLVERRHFIAMQAWSNATHQHRGTFLGNVWLILAPLLDGAVYFVIFGILFHVQRGVPNYPAYLIVGVLLFTYTSRSLTSSVGCLHANRGLIRAFTFPRAAVPLATVLRETISTLPVLLAVFVLVLLVSPSALSPLWTLIPFLFVLHAGFNLGWALVLARIGFVIPDVQQLLRYVVRFLMYGSAVIFSIERYREIPWLQSLVAASPIYQFLTAYRDLLLYHTVPPAATWGTLLAWAVGSTLVGLVFFWQGEVTYGRG